MAKTQTIFDAMAYSNDTEKRYEVTHVEGTHELTIEDKISYVKCHSYDGDIDMIEVFNHTTKKYMILGGKALNSRVYKD